MANPEHVEIVKQGEEAIRDWQERHPDVSLDLSGADLRGANLSEANLNGADLRGAKLSEAKLIGAYLSEADLSEADLSGAYLVRAVLVRAKLIGADLIGANLSETILSECYFWNAKCLWTIWGNVDLSEVKGLDSIMHVGPSTIGIDTLYNSRGKIPDVFLRGCGVPDEMIVYHHSLVGKAFVFFSCFISFTEADDDFSLRLYNDLRGAGIRCWQWKEDARWGRTLMREVDAAVRVYDKLVVICSEDSLKAEPVIREIERALQREQRDGKEILFPIRIDESVFSWEHELQADLVRKTIGDFREWKKPESYKVSLERLIRNLKPSPEERTSID